MLTVGQVFPEWGKVLQPHNGMLTTGQPVACGETFQQQYNPILTACFLRGNVPTAIQPNTHSLFPAGKRSNSNTTQYSQPVSCGETFQQQYNSILTACFLRGNVPTAIQLNTHSLFPAGKRSNSNTTQYSQPVSCGETFQQQYNPILTACFLRGNVPTAIQLNTHSLFPAGKRPNSNTTQYSQPVSCGETSQQQYNSILTACFLRGNVPTAIQLNTHSLFPAGKRSNSNTTQYSQPVSCGETFQQQYNPILTACFLRGNVPTAIQLNTHSLFPAGKRSNSNE